ncbi:MAG: tRNA (adenosine(37)-N6)-dimethylallyltransferase MiaA [Mitsuokella sp.]|uniref:tRNA (adenosine(37)-N6)-dimethylallyltransferase MiaA n=1 Tax=Mitsuokella sp. TaxID=2049034 RepID=UPI003D7DAD05
MSQSVQPNSGKSAAAGGAGNKEKLIAILGPTASGKTALSVELAKALHTEIISGDSMLVYKGFDIGSAKPTLAERQGVKHHLIDICEPAETYSVPLFQQQAEAIIHELNGRGKIPILAGGTGLYSKALLENYQFNETGTHADFRQKMTALAEKEGLEAVFALLQQENPQAAALVDAKNPRRVIRALELAHFGETISREKSFAEHAEGEESAEDLQKNLFYDAFVIGLSWEREALYERINRRVDIMFASGLEEEVRGLLASGVTRSMPAMKGIGYKETAAYLAGEMTRAEAVETIKRGTRRFAKRQLTWYRKMKYIHWYEPAAQSADELLHRILHDMAGFLER